METLNPFSLEHVLITGRVLTSVGLVWLLFNFTRLWLNPAVKALSLTSRKYLSGIIVIICLKLAIFAIGYITSNLYISEVFSRFFDVVLIFIFGYYLNCLVNSIITDNTVSNTEFKTLTKDIDSLIMQMKTNRR